MRQGGFQVERGGRRDEEISGRRRRLKTERRLKSDTLLTWGVRVTKGGREGWKSRTVGDL